MLFTHQEVEFMPGQIEEGVIYISPKFKLAIHKCACGCGHEAVTPLGPDDWSLTQKDGKVTLSPSIANRFECRSHYFIRDSEVVWC